MIWLAAQHFCQLSELPLFNDTDEVLITLKSFNFPRGSKMWSPLPPSMPESVVPIFRALGPLETYLSELYTHNFGTIGCAIWVDTDVGYYFLLLVLFFCIKYSSVPVHLSSLWGQLKIILIVSCLYLLPLFSNKILTLPERCHMTPDDWSDF